MQVDAGATLVLTNLEEIRNKFIELKTEKKITDQCYGLKGYGKFLPVLVEGPQNSQNPSNYELKQFYAFNISTDEKEKMVGLGFVYLINFGHKFSSLLNDSFNYEKFGLNLAYI